MVCRMVGVKRVNLKEVLRLFVCHNLFCPLTWKFTSLELFNFFRVIKVHNFLWCQNIYNMLVAEYPSKFPTKNFCSACVVQKRFAHDTGWYPRISRQFSRDRHPSIGKAHYRRQSLQVQATSRSINTCKIHTCAMAATDVVGVCRRVYAVNTWIIQSAENFGSGVHRSNVIKLIIVR